jgi:general L-amino acid transport system permease protein
MSDALPTPLGLARGARPPPARRRVPLWRTLFGDLASAVVSVTGLAVLLAILPKLLSWAVVNGVWRGGGEACDGGGACWAFLREKTPFIVFGIYPPESYWRPILVVVVLLALTLWSLAPKRWTAATLWLWTGGTLACLWLMGGGFGLSQIPTGSWGGLPVTLLLTVLSLGLGFPLAVALALGRQSELPAVRWLSIGAIELVRGLPLLSILFIASVLLPIMLPDGVTVDKLLRALAALTLFAAAYIAEVLRGGLQGIPRGQAEAARALGLSWWQTMRQVVLPQAVSKVIPPLTNTVVVIVKNTSLVLVVGLFDLLSSGRAALTDPDWPAPFVETYALVALIYFVICFGISRYTLWLERRAAFGASR